MSERKTRRVSRKLQDGAKVLLGVGSTVVVGGGMAMGCLDRPIETVEPRTTSTNVQRLTQSSVDKIDVLLMIDNSSSMADKQVVLARAVPKLIERLVFPQCVDADGNPEPNGATTRTGPCPDSYKAEFDAVRDINVGVISSSLGAAGSNQCEGAANQDLGRLLSRKLDGSTAPTYQNLGFLAWDPDQKRECADGSECPGSSDSDGFISTLTDMVAGVGESGCGYEASLEAAYHFLVEPEPWLTIGANGTKEGRDDLLLEQRAAFLRPDSLVAVILLTDENDCSFRIDGLGTFGASRDTAMPRPREECAADPNDACCASCIEAVPEGCSGNGGCEEPGCVEAAQCPGNFFDASGPESDANTRCADQKRRFGVDFLYPTERYVNAFSRPLINPRRLDLSTDGENDVANPLFAGNRGSDLVFVAGIAGVPWQLISRKNDAGEPDLALGFQTYDELVANDIWKQLLPESATDVADDPHMIESITPRAGLSETLDSDPINGNEVNNENTDVQYACIFPLPPEAYKDCGGDNPPRGCDCGDPVLAERRPLCGDDGDGGRSLQVKAKAYPGTRILEVLNGLTAQGIPASICPAQLALEAGQTEDDKDYGYTPAVFAIIDRLKTKLGGACQPRQLVADDEGNVPCIVIEARDSDRDGNAETTSDCNCNGEARAEPEGGAAIAADQIRDELSKEEPSPGYDCLCEVTQLAGDERTECQNEETTNVNGWCYVDATSTPQVGNPALVENCPPSEQRLVRFVGAGEVEGGGRLYITCSGEAK